MKGPSLLKEMIDQLMSERVTAHNIAEGRMAYAPVSWSGYMIDRNIGSTLPTNCKNCGAPLHGDRCEYCGTEY